MLTEPNLCFDRVGSMVGVTGIEPVRYRYRGILSPLCLPVPPHPHILRKLFIISLTYINIITYFFTNVKFFGRLETRLIFFCPLGLTTSLSPHMWWGERGFEPAQHLSDGFTVHILLLKSFSFTLHIYYNKFFIKNQLSSSIHSLIAIGSPLRRGCTRAPIIHTFLELQ